MVVVVVRISTALVPECRLRLPPQTTVVVYVMLFSVREGPLDCRYRLLQCWSRSWCLAQPRDMAEVLRHRTVDHFPIATGLVWSVVRSCCSAGVNHSPSLSAPVISDLTDTMLSQSSVSHNAISHFHPFLKYDLQVFNNRFLSVYTKNFVVYFYLSKQQGVELFSSVQTTMNLK